MLQDVNPTIFHQIRFRYRFRILAKFALLDSNQAKHHSYNIRSHIKTILNFSKSTGQNRDPQTKKFVSAVRSVFLSKLEILIKDFLVRRSLGQNGILKLLRLGTIMINHPVVCNDVPNKML